MNRRPAGLLLALALLAPDALRFSDVATTTAASRPWDDDVTRWEGVVGYRLTRDVRVKLGAQRSLRQPFALPRVRTDLLAASLSLKF